MTAFYNKKPPERIGRLVALNHIVSNMFQSAQALPANKLLQRLLIATRDLLDKQKIISFVSNMTKEITASIFRSDDEGYIAVFRPCPGIFGRGSCPEAASSDLLERFFESLNDLTPLADENLEWEGCQSFSLNIVTFFEN